MAKQCTHPKRPRNSAWFKEKLMLVEAQEAAFQTEYLDAYDLDCDDISLAKAVLMANLSSCDSDVLSKLKHSNYNPDTSVKSHTPVRIESSSELPKCFIDKNAFEIQIKQLSIDNDQLLKQIISQEIMHIVVNYVDILNVNKSCVDECNKCLELETEDNSGENQNAPTFNQLFEINELKAQLQENDTVIRKLNDMIKSLSGKDSVENVKKDINEIERINIDIENELKKLKGKNVVDTVVSKPIATIALGMFKLDIEPISYRLKNNKDAHEVYLEKTIENTNTLRGLELLVYVSKTCPSLTKPYDKLVAVTPMNKDKKFRFVEPVTSSSNIPKQTGSLRTKDSNMPLLTSTGVNTTTSASGSKLLGNTKIRISRPPSSNQKNKVEEHPRCPLTRITSTKEVPLKESTITPVITPSPEIKIWNDHIGKIMGYGDYQMGNVTISRVYYVEGLGHNLFSMGQFCDSDLEVAFRKHTCFIRDLEGVDLLKGSRGLNLYTLSMENLLLSSPICLLSKASKTKSWLWHQRLSHLNFDYITSLAKQGLIRGLPKLKYQKDHLCSTCALGKSKKHSHKPKAKDSIQEKLYLLHMDLCRTMRIQSIIGRKYILVIVDDYSQFTWVKFLRSKDEVPEFVIKFLKMIQVCLNATVCNIRTDNSTKFVNQTLRAYYEEVRISHQTSVSGTPQQNLFVKRRNHTLVEATMLIFSKAPLFLWPEAAATACYTQN
ncbi:retrovirus-related pol polyprotein from transposon TNT 1-94 [Tanacetum coccineum]